jgi:putative heme-binding domain-containing protein
VLKLVDLPEGNPLRPIALRALANQADAVVVDGLIARLGSGAEPARRREYADLLTRVYRQPAPWKYWGYRPAPRTANSVAWERTGAIGAALERTLHDPDRDVRLHALTRMRREQVPASLPTLAAWLREERGKHHAAEILSALKDHPPRETFALCEDVVRQRDHDVQNRLAAVALLLAASKQRPGWVPKLMTEIEDGPVMGALIRDARWSPDDASTLLGKLDSSSAIVRGVTLRVLTQHNVPGTAAHVPALLDDADPEVRRAAAVAVGKLQVADGSQKLLELAGGSDIELRSICLDSLRQLGDARAMSLAAASLEQPAVQRAALDYLAQWDGIEHAAAVARLAAQVRSHEIVAAAIAALASWESRASTDSAARRRLHELIAQTQGAAGIMLSWELRPEDESRVRRVLADRENPEGRVMLHEAALAETEVVVAEPASVEFLAGTSGPLHVSLNDEVIYDSQKPAKYQADAVRFTGQLQAGRNRLLVRLSNGPEPAQFHLRFRHVGDNAEHERLAKHLLTATGNGQRGGEVFRNMEKSLCLKCHRLGSDGGRIGPDLAGIGSRFSRVHLIESILQPSRAIAPSFETHVVALVDGRIVSGVRIAEDDQTLTLGDDQGRTHAIPKADIDERQTQTKSTMPDGLEKRLTDRELADLLAFLLQQKKGP